MSKKAFGTHEIARICQVTPPTIGRWIEEGKLPSFKTGGGHRRVWDVDLVAFLRAHNIPIPSMLAGVSVRRILIVDDEVDMRRFIQGIVSKRFPGAEIHEAGDGFDAGRKIATLFPALVILDLRLPGMDGFKVCRTVRADPALKGVKILAITGVGVEDSRQQILDAGADAFLPKPFLAEDLAAKLEELLPGESSKLDE
jgi:excisionase family DNA binding protein